MTIVITDGQTLNPGDLDWAPLQALGDLRYFDTTPREKVAEHCHGANVIVTNKTIIPAEVIESNPSIRLIAVSATGYNNVDINSAKSRGVVVCNVPEYGTYSVAQHTIALLLEITNSVGIHVQSTKRDEWAKETWSYTRKPIAESKNKVLGIVGLGRIGNQVALIAEAIGMKVIFSNRSQVIGTPYKQVALPDLFSSSDVVSLHCPLTNENKHFVDYGLLRQMKKTSVLINTSRGALIREDDLVRALDEGLLYAAALDVLTEEPPQTGHALVHHPRCIVTPHNAWISFEARSRLMQVTVENVRSFLNGKVQNQVF
jgi:glycerate dehydrogenase